MFKEGGKIVVVVKRIELSIDIARPSEEILQTIAEVIGYYPGRQLDILKKVDQGVGDLLAAFTPKEDTKTAKDNTEDSP